RAETAMSGPAIRAVSEILQTPKDGVRTRGAEQPVSAVAADEKDDARKSGEFTLHAPEIAARGVTFSYPSAGTRSEVAPPVLQHVDFTMPSGQITALVAPSGMGKTTLFRLLLRFYEPQDGTIFLQGRDLQSIPTAALRRQSTLISQRPAFFQGSIRTNFLAANPKATDAEIQDLAERYGLWPILTASYGSNPLDAPFFHGSASRLSGGQEKRFALVRGMLNSPALLLLDEPTTGIDPFEKTLLTAPLVLACEGRTTILVDHDILWQASICHHIVVLNNGSVLDEGSREELMSRPGPFMDMYQEALRSQQPATGSEPPRSMPPQGFPVIHAGGRPDFDDDGEMDEMEEMEEDEGEMGDIMPSQKVMPFGLKPGARKPFR
ncbi:MAG: ATP-binding cassette domain-containing protein, partial [Candidatus Methylacidiphilales bacterium]